jgi:DNA-binding MarR family transcriptional regulator
MSVARQEIADQLHSSALHLVRMVRTVDAGMGLSPARASALSVLVFGGPRTVGALADAEGVRSPTMTRLINGLESDGLVHKGGAKDDRRQVVVEATAAARRLLESGRRRRVSLLDDLLAGLDADDLEVLRRAAILMEDAVSAAGDGDLPA